MRLRFGLGTRDQVDHIELRWIGGKTDHYRNISVDKELLLAQGESAPRPGK